MNTSNLLKEIFKGLPTVILAGLPAGSAVFAENSERPNIVLLIGDDISPDFGCYGGPARTPNIDQLATGGMRFENAYVTASSCSPSRGSIITGRYPHNTGAPELHMGAEKGQFLFPLALKESGYYTLLAGKWHMGGGDHIRQAFDETFDVPYAKDPTGAARWVQCLAERPLDKPFFMWFAAWDAHRLWEPDPEGIPFKPADAVLPAGVPDTVKSREDMACYYNEVQRFDRYVGKVVAELKRQNIFDNTLIILLGDNGRPFPRNKTTLYDNGVKVPLIVHWPAGHVKSGAVSKSLVSAIDIAPAVLQAAGLPVPPQVQGVSFLPILREPENKIRDYVFAERNWHVQRACARMVRQGDYVYIRNIFPQFYSFQMVEYDTGAYAELLRLKAEGKLTPEQAEEFSTGLPEEMLFRLTTDPQQLENLAGSPENKEMLEHLRRTLDSWQQQTGDSIPPADQLTPDRHDPKTFEKLFKESRPSGGILPGSAAGATTINDSGPR